MTSVVPENLDEFFEVSEIDTDILMSLLEESQIEESDDERLRTVIRSLEAEIDPIFMDDHISLFEDCQASDVARMDGEDCSTLRDHLNFNWIDMEMVSSPASDDMAGWYMDNCSDEIDGMAEFGGVGDYSDQIDYGVSLEENGYNSLWQETYQSVMYG